MELVIGAVTGLALVLAGVWWASELRDRPVRAALARANTTYAVLLADLAGAEDLGSIREAGDRAAAAVVDLEQAGADVAGRDDDFGRAVAEVIAGQGQIALAASRLRELTAAQLGVWGDAERDLTQARSALWVARAALARVEPTQSRDVTDPAKAIDHVRTLVGSTASRTSSRAVTALVGRLTDVVRTAQVRRIGREATATKTAVDAALAGLSGANADRVAAAGAVLDELGRLTAVNADHLDVWERVRVRLVEALDRVEVLSGPRATRAVDHLDAFIAEANARMAHWRTIYDRATRKQARARAILARYHSAVRAELTGYQALRAELAEFFGTVEAEEQAEPTTDPATVLAAAQSDREAILGGLEEITVPGPLQDAHAGLEAVVRHAANAVRRAYQSLGEVVPDCPDCGYRDTEGYQRFHAASARITAEYLEAESAWAQALAAVQDSISDQALPKKPKV